MIYNYDGSFDGLLTIVFEKYKEIGACEIEPKGDQINFLESEFVDTDLVKAERVIDSIKANIGEEFFADVFKVFKSNHKTKEEVIAVTIKSCLIYGRSYLGSSKRAAVEFRFIVKNFDHEVHYYKGLARFREIQEEFLLAEIEPYHDSLMHITTHFLRRMPREKFIIYDINRKKASLCIKGTYEEVEILEMEARETDEEKIFKEAWKGFYNAIGIDERKNHKLMISNMPKKYWKYLPEKQVNDK